MKIREIRWKNFRRLPDGVITVRRHLVMVGPNDTGKSSIVRALQLCLSIPHNHLPTSISPRDFTDPAQPLELTVELDDLDTDDKAAFPDELTLGPPETILVHFEATLDPNDHEQRAVRRTFPDSGHTRGPNVEQLRRIAFEVVPAVRSLAKELSGASGGAVRTLLSGLDLAADEQALTAATMAYRNALDNSGALQGFRSDLAAALTNALPRVVTQNDVRLTQESELLDDPLSGVTVTIRDGQNDVRLSEQSDGVKALSVLSLLGMSHKSARILAVDEPENHLHPIAQRSMAKALVAGALQSVVVTHSPYVVSQSRPQDLVAFRADRRVKQLPATAPVAGYEMTVRHWGPRLIEPITARRVLVVEGPVDRILLRRVAALNGVDLDRLGVNVFELDGADQFPIAHALFGPTALDLPLTGVVDADAAPRWAQTIGVAEADLANAGIDVCRPDLEGVYVAAIGAAAVTAILIGAGVISEQGLLSSCQVGALGQLTDAQLARFCGGKRRKVVCAIAIASSLTVAQSQTLLPLFQAIQRVQ